MTKKVESACDGRAKGFPQIFDLSMMERIALHGSTVFNKALLVQIVQSIIRYTCAFMKIEIFWNRLCGNDHNQSKIAGWHREQYEFTDKFLELSNRDFLDKY